LLSYTSRENLIPGAPKMLIPIEFGFTSDLHAGGNVLSLANLLYAPVIQKLSLANLLYALVIQKLSLANLVCAPGIKVIPGELESGSPGIKIQKIRKFQKIQKNSEKYQKNSKNGINIENCKYTIFLTIISHLESSQLTPK
jgi:hypothetical protein